MSGSAKLLKIVFFILIIVAAGEIFYLFFYRPAQPMTTSVPLSPTPEAVPNPVNQAIDTKTLNNLAFLEKGIVKSSLMTNEYEGEIIEVDDNGGVNPIDQIDYQFRIKIKSPSGQTNVFFYKEREAGIIKVFLPGETDKTSHIISVLKVGEKIIMDETIDLLKSPDDNLEKLEIFVL